MSAWVWGLLAFGAVLVWRRLGPACFDRLELLTVGWFARTWHRCSPDGPCTLPGAGPAILVANHPSHADPAFLIASSPRLLCFLQARECYDILLLRRLFRRVGCIPVSRDAPDLAAIRLALKRLREGKVVCLFPEGDVGEAGGDRVAPGKSGAALLALRSGAPVIPAHIRGGPRTRNLLWAWFWPSTGVRVVFGPPIDLSSFRGRRLDRHCLRQATARIMEGIAALEPAALPASPTSLVPCDAGIPSGSSS
jgi:1-acyl-sn-glycerol-3-phosphate acyltransferase